VTREIEIPESKKLVLEAFANRKFNADDVDDFRGAGVVGECISGLLTILPTDRYNDDLDYKQLVDRITEEENLDRQTIMSRIVEIHSAVNPLDPEAVTAVFAKMNRDATPSGTMIQAEDGTWERKR
jgi:uncharacterized protein YdbL (DUF1318 family)